MKEGWNVKIAEDWATRRLKIVALRKDCGVVKAYSFTDRDVVQILDGQEVGGDCMLSIEEEIADALIMAVINYANSKNIRTETEEKLQGKLSAMAAHLEDMRSLVFKKK